MSEFTSPQAVVQRKLDAYNAKNLNSVVIDHEDIRRAFPHWPGQVEVV
jgi:hypothetical protein